MSGATPPASATFEEPSPLVIARRASVTNADWFAAKSWLGGLPKLGTIPWPRGSDRKPLTFLAQLDLGEIAQAGRGRTALPSEGAFAFFVGFDGRKMGRIVHVKRPGETSTEAPDDIELSEEIGGDSLVDPSNRYGPKSFPYWPVEFRALTSPGRAPIDDDEGLERAIEAQEQAIAEHYRLRAFNFSASHIAKTEGLGDAPLYWLAALMFAERVPLMRDNLAKVRKRASDHIANAGARLEAMDAVLPAPPTQAPFAATADGQAKDRESTERWLAIGRDSLAAADAHAQAVESYIAKVAAAPFGRDPWQEIAAADLAWLDPLFAETRSKELEDYARYALPHDWRDYATDAIKLMAAGPNEAFAQLPAVWQSIINRDYRLAASGAHLMFAIGDNIQGNAMFEEADMRMVLQLTHDDLMYWPFGDNGVYQFWMPAAALKAGDVTQARVTFEAH